MNVRSISCVFGALLINLTLGTFYSIGNLVPYVASYMKNNGNPNVTSEHGTWITSAFLLGQGIFIIIGSHLEQRFNNRIACSVGCIIHCLSTFLTKFALNVNFPTVVLVYGLGSGFGCGSAYVASIIAAQKWFPRNKGLLTGIIVAGFGFGGLIFTPLQTLYLNPDNLSVDRSKHFSKEVYERLPNLFLYMGIVFTILQSIGCLLAFSPDEASNQAQATVDAGIGATNTAQNGARVYISDALPRITTIYAVFSVRIFYIIGILMMLVVPGVIFVNSLGKRYGQTYIEDDKYLSVVVAVSAVANALGRLTWGYMMDKLAFSMCFSIKIVLFSILIALFPFKFILASKVTYAVWMLGMFFGFSGTFVLFPVYIEQVFGSKLHGLIYGILYVFLAIASLITSLILSLTVAPALDPLINPDDNVLARAAPCITIAYLYITSLVIYYTALPVKKIQRAISHKTNLDNSMAKNSLSYRQDLFPTDRANLAEKTTGGGITKENSLGSIVRFRESPRTF